MVMMTATKSHSHENTARTLVSPHKLNSTEGHVVSRMERLSRLRVSVTRPKAYESLGIFPDEQLLITRIQPHSAAFNKLKLGDRIVSVEKTAVRTRDQYEKKMREHMTKNQSEPFVTTFEVMRRPHNEPSVLPHDRERLVLRRAGYQYKMVTLNYTTAQPHIGLHLKEIANRVLVSRADKDSIVHDKLFECDRIIDVDGMAVTSRAVARQLIKRSLSKANGQRTTVVIERPLDENTKSHVKRLLDSQAVRGHSNVGGQIVLPTDCVNIIRQLNTSRNTNPPKEPKSILHKKSSEAISSIIQDSTKTTKTNTKTKTKGNTSKKSTKSKTKSGPHARINGITQQVSIPSDYPQNTQFVKVPSNQSFL